MRSFQGIILDVDGTLVDSNDAHARAWVEAFGDHGYHADFQQVRRLIGKGGDHLIPDVAGIAQDSPEAKAVNKRRGEIFQQRELPHVQAFPQTRELLKQLQSHGMRLAVASSAQEDELAPLLEIAGAKDLIEKETSSADAPNSKPDPDIIQAALDKLGMTAEQTVMLGDTPYDVESAAKAGVKIIALRCGGWNDDDLTGAIAIYNDPADLLAHLADSPLG